MNKTLLCAIYNFISIVVRNCNNHKSVGTCYEVSRVPVFASLFLACVTILMPAAVIVYDALICFQQNKN